MDNQAFLLELLKNLNTAVVVHTPDTRIIYNNKCASVMLGLSEDQMRGKMAIDPAWHFINEQGIVLQLDDYPVNRVISSRQSFDNLVFGIVIPEQTEPTWVLVSAFPEFDLTGDLSRVVVNFYDITEQKKAEQELRKSESAFSGTFNQAAVGIAHVGTDGAWLQVNKKLCDIVGYNEDELMKLTFQDITYQDDLSIDLNYVKQMLAGEIKSYSMEKRYKRKSGELIWANLTVSLIRKSDESPGYFISVVEDISERKKIESSLMNERERIKAILNKLTDPVFLKDNDHRIVLANLAFYNMFGMEENDVIGKTLAEYVPENERQQFLANDRRVLDDDIDDQREETLTLSGFTRVIVTTKTRFVDNFGKRYLVGSIHDITDRRKAEQEVLIAATAFESHEGMSVTDAEGTILKVNASFSRITGYTSEEVVGKNPRLLKSGRQNNDFYELMWDKVKRTGSWDGEIWNRRKNGEIYPEFLTITAVTDKKGNITNYVGTFSDITLNKAAEEEIKNLAFYDTLTKLPNRRLLLDRLLKALATIPRSGNTGALLFLDLDNFKSLNDTLGHDIGDILLQQVAERLTACVRDGDTIARLGGDEFVVMLENLSSQSMEAAAQTEAIGAKILTELNQSYQLGSHNYNCSTSIGVTLFGDRKTDLDELLKQADIAMYQAKKAGRNVMRFFDLRMQTSINARVALEKDLRKAIEKRQFVLHYQVQVDETRKALGAEVLIRWQHSEMGFISPAQFIPQAEETGLIIAIGQWVLETACEQLCAWQKNPLMQHLTISVNVSAKQFHKPNFAMQVKHIIKHYAINPALLKLEPTESILLEDIDATVETMNALKAIGVHFALDDFGTGFSSLQYLKKLPLNQLKIDQTFVRDLVTDNNDQAIVRTIIAMAQSMNLQVIAEGVETEEQLQILRQSGCKHYQGYLFGKPMNIEEFEACLKQ